MKRRRRPYFWLLAAAIALAVLVGLAFSRPFESAAQAIVTLGGPKPPPPPLPGKRATFLVMGVDERPDDIGRSDSMMVVSYDQTREQLTALSLPRDTYVEIPGHGYDKLNHAYAFGGEGLARVAVERYLGMPIDHTVVLSFHGFAAVVDALGGIEVDAEKQLTYHDPYDLSMGPDGLVIDIAPGPQHMDGMTALKYARFRADDEGDIGRMRRQQQVLKAAMQAANTPAVIGKLTKLVPALQDAIRTDMSVADMVKLATSAKNALKNPLQSKSLGGTPQMYGGIFYLVPDLVVERTTAYQTLVGEAPPADFLAKARADQEALAKAVAEAKAEDAGSADDGSDDAQTADTAGSAAGTPASNGQQPETGKTTTGQTGPSQPTTGPTSGTSSKTGTGTTTGSNTGTATTKVQPITIAVVDGSGRDLLADYVKKFKAAGFRVARVGRLTKPVSQTVAIDHTGRAATTERVKSVLPGALVVVTPDANAGEAVEIVLGLDSVK